jgi:hypothetical protein
MHEVYVCDRIKMMLGSRVGTEPLLKFSEVLAVSTLLHGLDCRAQAKKQQESRTEATETRFLTAVAVYRATDSIRK